MRINNMELLESKSKGKNTSSRDLISPNKVQPKQETKKIGSGKNDIIERSEQKVVIEDGRELLK